MVQKKILVTGGNGFLGSHLIKALLQEGHQVVLFIREHSDKERLRLLMNRLECYTLRPEHFHFDLSLPFSTLDIDLVIHCATNYGRENTSAKSVLETNTLMPLHLLELAIEYKIPFFNTDTVLPSTLNLYALSKHQFIELSRVLIKDHIQYVNFKFEHFYGEDDDPRKFTSHVVKACLQEIESLALTKGEQLRDFIYIDDAVSAFMTVIRQLYKIPMGFSEVHVGTGNLISVRNFVEMVKKLTKSSTRLDFGAVQYRTHELMSSSADISTICALGWRSEHDLESGLKKMIENFKILPH